MKADDPHLPKLEIIKNWEQNPTEYTNLLLAKHI